MTQIIDFNSLKSEVKLYCARNDTDFDNAFERFVALAENRIYYGFDDVGGMPTYSPPLRSKEMEASVTVSLTLGTGTLPSDYIGARALRRSSDKTGLEYLPPSRFHIEDAQLNGGNPIYYTIEGGNLLASQDYTGDLTLLYWQKFPAITSTAATGTLLSAHPDAYFAATLAEAYDFMRNDAQHLKQVARYNSLIKGLNRTAQAMRYGGQTLKMKTRSRMP